MSKFKFTVLVIFTFISVNLTAQTLSMYKTFGGVHYMKSDSLISENQVRMILLKEAPAAYEEFKTAKKIGTFSSIVGFTGGVLIIVPLATAVLGGEPEWAL